MKANHFLLLLLSVFLACLCGCSPKSQEVPVSNEAMDQAVEDGFKLSDVAGSMLTTEEQDLWETAADDVPDGLEPLTVLAEHASGDLLYLCRNSERTGLDGWMIAAVRPEDGRGTLLKLETFDIWIRTYGLYETPEIPENDGWKVRIPADETALFTGDMYGIIQIAVRNLRNGTAYVPVVLLAEQLVAGTNYKYLCTDEAGAHLYILDIYEDMNNGAEINAAGYVDLTMYGAE